MDSLSKRLEELKKIVLSTDENPDSEERSEDKKSEEVGGAHNKKSEKKND